MELQETYEKIKAHFSKPGTRYGYDPLASCCRYRTPEGDKCAVGILISDEIYEKLGGDGFVEGNDVSELATWPELKEIVNGDSVEGRIKLDFLKSVQRAHDVCAERGLPMEEFLRRLDDRAEEFGLSVPSRA